MVSSITKTAISGGALLVAGMMMAQGASAGPAFNATLDAPGFYNGSGNPSSEFTKDTEAVGGGNVEIGLRARFRGGPDVTPVGNVYHFDPGAGSNPALARWNYDFSVNLENSGLHMADVIGNTTLTVTDVGTGVSATVKLTHWTDNASYESGPVIHQNGTGNGLRTTTLGEQNSENLAFADSPLAGDFNFNAVDTYLFTLTLINDLGTTLASTTIQVDVPEPSTLAVLGIGLLGIGALRRRRKIAA